ncbi:MAG: flagellar hook-basal body complex protein FliE [Lachnospiraceae bacterium]|nr:flagellar hook-basal body complex protein FliE [Lachnospiraceae bacterium]
MDITSLYNINSGAIQSVYDSNRAETLGGASVANDDDLFASFLDSAMANIKSTNAYLSDAENEKLRFAMGETDNTHDLTIAMQKASTALQYTVAVRDKFLEAYKEIMNMQI